MDELLSADGWNDLAKEHEVADRELKRALVRLGGLEPDDFDARIECCGRITELAADLKRDEAIAASTVVVKYLTEMIKAAQEERREVTRCKSGAGRDAPDGEGPEDVDAGVAKYPVQLLAALEKLKSAQDPFRFVVCLGKPLCAVMVAKERVSSSQMRTLSALTGTKRFLKPGTCRREGGTLVFDLDGAPKGLAARIRNSIEHFTGKKFRVRFGDEVVEGDPAAMGADEPSGDVLRPRGSKPALESAPQVWSVTQRVVKARIGELKAAILEAFAAEGPELVREVERNLKKLDGIFERLDDELASILERAAAAPQRERQGELRQAAVLLAEHVKFVRDEPMLAHVDANPFGVATNLQATLVKALKHVVRAVGQ